MASRATFASLITIPYCCSMATVNCSASSESRPTLPGPNNGVASPISSGLILRTQFSTTSCFKSFSEISALASHPSPFLLGHSAAKSKAEHSPVRPHIGSKILRRSRRANSAAAIVFQAADATNASP